MHIWLQPMVLTLLPIPNDVLEQEVEEPINFTSLFVRKNVADGHNKAIAEELAD
jgi:hypothetical protein